MSRDDYRAQTIKKLTDLQEKKLCDYIDKLTEYGVPPTFPQIRRWATEISKDYIGKGWPGSFVKRNEHRLSTAYLNALEISRKRSDSSKSYSAWFTEVNLLIKVINPVLIFTVVRDDGPAQHPVQKHL